MAREVRSGPNPSRGYEYQCSPQERRRWVANIVDHDGRGGRLIRWVHGGSLKWEKAGVPFHGAYRIGGTEESGRPADLYQISRRPVLQPAGATV